MVIIVNCAFWIIVVGLFLYGLRRGGSALLGIGVLLVLAAMLASWLAPICTSCFPTANQDTTTYSGIWQLILMLLLGGTAFPLGIYLNRFLQWSLDPFDQFIGGILGIIIAVIVTHYLLGSFLLIYHHGEEAAILDRLTVVRQIVYLDGWNTLIHWFATLSTSHTVDLPK